MNKQSYERPVAGIFYMIPDPTNPGRYTLYPELQEPGEQPVVHLFLFDSVRKILEIRFKADPGDAYTGIPRGRITEPIDPHGVWVVHHGGDFQLEKYKSEILTTFSLSDAYAIGKVKFEEDVHEKMGLKDRKQVESELGIIYTPVGWKKSSQK